MEIQTVILAGGLATRLGGLTLQQPKSMLKIMGKPFMEYQLELLKVGGIKNIVVCLGHLGEQIENYFGNGRKYGVSILYSYEDTLLGTAGALKKAEPLLDDIFFTIYGDSYLFLDFPTATEFFIKRQNLAMMTVYKNEGRFDSSNTSVHDNMVARYSKDEKSTDMVYIDYGVNFFRKKALEFIPDNRFYGFEKLFPELIEKRELLAFTVNERFYEIGSLSGLKDLEDYLTKKAGQ